MNPKIDLLRDKANRLVERPGVYLMKNKQKEIIYIGKAKRLKNRVVSYFRQNKGHTEKVRKMVSQVDDFDYIVADSEFEALVLECSLIKQYTPKYNILLKDDKGYHYIKITNEDYPRIQAVKQKLDDGASYLGPYTSAYTVKQSVEEVNKLFRLPTCGKKFPQDFRKERPCLNFHIHNCCGLCQGRIKQEEYQATIREAMSYLKNGSAKTMESLRAQMEEAAENLEFERAAKLRDKLRAMERLTLSQKVFLNASKDQDFIGLEQTNELSCIVVLKFRNGQLHDKDYFFFEEAPEQEELLSEFLSQYYRQGRYIPKMISLPVQLEDMEVYQNYFSQLSGKKIILNVPQKGEQKKQIAMAEQNALEELSLKLQKKSREIVALQELQKLLGLSKLPEYIESYDISNMGNDYMVGGMIVFENAKPLKSAYKKFSMKENATQDDYACMQEVLRRRFAHYLDPEEKDEGFRRLPDLILLDGGAGHVNAVRSVLESMGIQVPLFGMVKDSRHRTRAITGEGGEIQISTCQSAFRLTTMIQDEVHRFAITYQRQKHKKNAFSLELTQIKGIGPKKAAALMKRFRTKKGLKEAELLELKEAGGLTDQAAQALYDLIQSW